MSWKLAFEMHLVDPVLLPSPAQSFNAFWHGLEAGSLRTDLRRAVALTGISFAVALVIVIVAGMFIGATDGLGQRSLKSQMVFDMPDMYAPIFAAGAPGYLLTLLFIVAERRSVYWSGK